VPYSIELRFDDALTEAVALWSEAVTELTGLPHGVAEPHVSLAVYDERGAVDPAELVAALDRLGRRHAPTPVTFASLGVFPTEERVLFLAPVVTPQLLALHHAWHSLSAALRPRCRPYYWPGNWVPHCTIAMFLPLPDLLRALEQLAGRWKPLGGEVRHVALVEDAALTVQERPFAGQVSRRAAPLRAWP
jgi:2'-5' RNA ligase